jgi:hypothetical protein
MSVLLLLLEEMVVLIKKRNYTSIHIAGQKNNGTSGDILCHGRYAS